MVEPLVEKVIKLLMLFILTIQYIRFTSFLEKIKPKCLLVNQDGPGFGEGMLS